MACFGSSSTALGSRPREIARENGILHRSIELVLSEVEGLRVTHKNATGAAENNGNTFWDGRESNLTLGGFQPIPTVTEKCYPIRFFAALVPGSSPLIPTASDPFVTKCDTNQASWKLCCGMPPDRGSHSRGNLNRDESLP
jgi:hypothetical protein